MIRKLKRKKNELCDEMTKKTEEVGDDIFLLQDMQDRIKTKTSSHSDVKNGKDTLDELREAVYSKDCRYHVYTLNEKLKAVPFPLRQSRHLKGRFLCLFSQMKCVQKHSCNFHSVSFVSEKKSKS